MCMASRLYLIISNFHHKMFRTTLSCKPSGNSARTSRISLHKKIHQEEPRCYYFDTSLKNEHCISLSPQNINKKRTPHIMLTLQIKTIYYLLFPLTSLELNRDLMLLMSKQTKTAFAQEAIKHLPSILPVQELHLLTVLPLQFAQEYP